MTTGLKIKGGIPLSRGSLILKWRFGSQWNPASSERKRLLSILLLAKLSGTPQPRTTEVWG